ncbi:uncharacterized protein LOC136076044 [Hydra vulgaris]|uniref:Uncharacterized protein LOC136076044 n=1 Tax=Hydra vulgaris TaxID=6087 RepID=A0ABM4B9K2_HYDVU
MTSRKDIDENKMKIWIKEILTQFNAVKMLKCELLSDNERLQIKNAFQDNVCLEIKLFVKESLYPYPKFNENGKLVVKKEKMKERNQAISDFVSDNYNVLKDYFNSTRFKRFHEIINYYSNKLILFDTIQPTKTVIDLLRQQFDSDYNKELYYTKDNLYYLHYEALEEYQENNTSENATSEPQGENDTNISSTLNFYDLPQSYNYADNIDLENRLHGEIQFQQNMNKILPVENLLNGDVASGILADQEKWKLYINVGQDPYAFSQILSQNRQNEFNSQVDQKNISETLRLNRLSHSALTKNIEQTRSKIYVLTPLDKFLFENEISKKSEVVTLLANNQDLYQQELQKYNIIDHLIDMCQNQINYQYGSHQTTLKVYKPRTERATLNNLKIYIIYLSKVVDVDESLANIIQNITNTTFEKINDPKQYSFYSNEFLNLLTSPNTIGKLRFVADYYQIKHLTFAKLWNFIQKYNLPFRSEKKLTLEVSYKASLESEPYTVLTSAFLESDSINTQSYSAEKAFNILSKSKPLVNSWLVKYAGMFRGDEYDILKEYIRKNHYLLQNQNIYELLISNYNENAVSNTPIGENMLYLTIKTFFSDVPSLPFRETDEVVLLKENVFQHMQDYEMFLNEMIKNSNQFYDVEPNMKQKSLLEMMIIMGTLYNSNLARLKLLLIAYKNCFDISLYDDSVEIFISMLKQDTALPKNLNLYIYPKSVLPQTFPSDSLLFSELKKEDPFEELAAQLTYTPKSTSSEKHKTNSSEKHKATQIKKVKSEPKYKLRDKKLKK